MVLREVQPHLLQAVSWSPFLCCLAKISKAWTSLGLNPVEPPGLWGQGCLSEQWIFSWEHPPTSQTFKKVPGTVLYILLGVYSEDVFWLEPLTEECLTLCYLRIVCPKRCWAWAAPPDLISTPTVNEGLFTLKAVPEQCCMWMQWPHKTLIKNN